MEYSYELFIPKIGVIMFEITVCLLMISIVLNVLLILGFFVRKSRKEIIEEYSENENAKLEIKHTLLIVIRLTLKLRRLST